MAAPENSVLTPATHAAIQLIGRTGATNFQIRFSDDEQPTVWIAVAVYGRAWEAAAGQTPHQAIIRLCEQLVDGGECTHCHRPTMFMEEMEEPDLLFCVYAFDPELATYRRSCEGDTR